MGGGTSLSSHRAGFGVFWSKAISKSTAESAFAGSENCNDNAITTQTASARNDSAHNPLPLGSKANQRGTSCVSLFPKRSGGEGGTQCRVRVKKAAFTLAEVLITLAIIGIVAALTIPALISKYQDRALETAYQKAKASIANGYKLMMAQEGVFSINDLSLFNECLDMTSYDDSKNCVRKSYKNSFRVIEDAFYGDQNISMNLPDEYSSPETTNKSPFRWLENFDSQSGSDNIFYAMYVYKLQDGGIYGLYDFSLRSSEYESWQNSLFIAVDVNGSNNPNMVGEDLYLFRLSDNGTVSDVTFELEASGCSFDALDKCNPWQCERLVDNCKEEKGCITCDRGQWDYESNTCTKVRIVECPPI